MTRPIMTVAELQNYVRGIAARTRHHAPSFEHAWMPLVGVVLAHKDKDSQIEVRTYAGSIAVQTWFHIRGIRYTLKYDHEKQVIELRRPGRQSAALASFTGESSSQDIHGVFSQLRTRVRIRP
jgi:hypothetical protein